jgi:hypothetical protein
LATTAEINILDGVTATAAELNALDGITSTVTELNYTDGVTSAIQTQIDAKAALVDTALTGTPTAPTATSGTDTTQVATTAFANAAVEALAVGVGQTWQDLSGSRVSGTSYQNTTGRPIMVSVAGADNTNFEVSTDNSTWIILGFTDTDQDNGSQPGGLIIPDLTYYRQTGSGARAIWVELR